MKKQACLGLSAVLFSTLILTAQDVSVSQARADGSVRFLVMVTTQSGQPVADLRKQDFTVFDDDEIRPIKSFRTIPASKTQDEIHTFMGVSMANSPSEPGAISCTYEIIFDGAKSSGRRQFHEVGIKIDRPNLKIATRPGYLTSAYSRLLAP
jgi:hypothetical protein